MKLLQTVFAPFIEPVGPGSWGVLNILSWGQSAWWWIYTEPTGWYKASHGSHMDGAVEAGCKIDVMRVG